jgi:hypothetical protein
MVCLFMKGCILGYISNLVPNTHEPSHSLNYPIKKRDGETKREKNTNESQLTFMKYLEDSICIFRYFLIEIILNLHLQFGTQAWTRGTLPFYD